MRKPGTARDIPPPLELECLNALWNLGDGSVKDVRQVVTESRNLAYTTVMTVLDRLVKRGSVERRKKGRLFVYTPVVGREELRRLAVSELVDTFFDGSRKELMNYLDVETAARPEATSVPNVPELPKPMPSPAEDSEPLDTELL